MTPEDRRYIDGAERAAKQIAKRVHQAHAGDGQSLNRVSRVFRDTELPAEMRAAAARRLGIVAFINAVVFVCMFATFLATDSRLGVGERLVATYGADAIVALPPAIVVISFLLSVILFGVSRLGRVSPERLLRLGVLYQVLIALVISLLTHITGWEGITDFKGWSGITVWIIVFAVLIPSTPRRVLVISLAAAAMDPLGLLITHLLGAPLPPATLMVRLFVPTLLSVALAVVCSVLIHRLGQDVERARLLGSYELVELLGQGGMGEVWRAQHRMLARPAAIKLIRRESLAQGDEEDARVLAGRFEREAQATATLESPHTVTLYDYGVTDDGSFYYVMELLRGVDLEELIARWGPLAPERLVALLIQVCRSLEEAHHTGLIHRDLKPANIFVARRGLDHDVVKVLDFGLVKREADGGLEGEATKLTSKGTVTGTPDYIAPEMVSGDPVDGRTDLYSLGCVAYFALTGQPVFSGKSLMKIVVAHVSEAPAPLSSRVSRPVPGELEALIHDCLEKQPERRPASARRVRERLGAITFDRPWTPERADAWWAEHLSELAPAEGARADDLGVADTLIDGEPPDETRPQ